MRKRMHTTDCGCCLLRSSTAPQLLQAVAPKSAGPRTPARNARAPTLTRSVARTHAIKFHLNTCNSLIGGHYTTTIAPTGAPFAMDLGPPMRNVIGSRRNDHHPWYFAALSHKRLLVPNHQIPSPKQRYIAAAILALATGGRECLFSESAKDSRVTEMRHKAEFISAASREW